MTIIDKFNRAYEDKDFATMDMTLDIMKRMPKLVSDDEHDANLKKYEKLRGACYLKAKKTVTGVGKNKVQTVTYKGFVLETAYIS